MPASFSGDNDLSEANVGGVTNFEKPELIVNTSGISLGGNKRMLFMGPLGENPRS